MHDDSYLAIARNVVNGFTGDEFTDWIDTEAAVNAIADAIRAAVAAQRERDAQIADSYRDKAGTAYYVCDFIAAAIRAQS